MCQAIFQKIGLNTYAGTCKAAWMADIVFLQNFAVIKATVLL
jgi:hypothetical protein